MTHGNSRALPDYSRRLKYCNDFDDMISNLPDSIIGHILSFLPTKDAVATGILSRRWKFLWTTTINLDFYCPEDYTHQIDEYESKRSKFIRFVNYVLLVHQPTGCLNKLSLTWKGNCDTFYVNAWINAVVVRNVHHLFISVSEVGLMIQVPRSMFSCQGLQSLELNCQIRISTEIVISLPKLESLKLISVYLQSDDVFCKLLAGCPVLKYLYIDMDMENMIEDFDMSEDDGFVFSYKVSSTSLRHLELYVRDDTFQCSVELAASSLEYIKLVGLVSTSIIVRENLSSLVEANIKLFELENEEYDYCNPVVDAVQAFDCVKALILSGEVIWALSCATINLRTRFKRLTKLEVELTSCWNSLLDLLKMSDSLKVLTVNMNTYYIPSFDQSDSNWKEPNRVPRCLSNSLKTVSFCCYLGGYDECAMIGYFLRQGCAIKLMQIKWDGGLVEDFKTKCQLIQQISKFPRKSPVCEVEFVNMAW